jgi:eukaryotic-like serine/threonine-protein kinase
MPSIAIGEKLDGPNSEIFKITAFLGQGAFGEVYMAVGESSGTVVAVKLLPVMSLPSESSKTALLNEITAAQRVVHPNVVKVLHVDNGASSPVGPFVFMEYVSGGTLATLPRVKAQSGTQIPLTRAMEMMIDIAQGTQAINEKLIHRDIEPDNILVEGGTLKIGDFGISKFADESTRLHTFKGGQHIAYMAPETWQNQTNTFKLDVYSVGLVFHQILTLKHPLEDKVKDPSNFLDWERAHLYAQCLDVRTLRDEVTVSISQLVSRMVSKRPSDRPGWDEVLNILSKPETTNTADHPAVKAAVEAVIARKQKEQEELLKAAQRQNQRENEVALYGYSCDAQLKQFEPAVEQFNRECQHGRISESRERGFILYRIPSGKNIEVSFFEPRVTGVKVRGGQVIGGGWIGISNGRSANLVLLKEGPDDLYGRWVVCEIGIMALVDTSRLIGRFGLTRETIVPFGFKDVYFYDQIQYATGITHAFTYNFIDDVVDYFAQLLLEASK